MSQKLTPSMFTTGDVISSHLYCTVTSAATKSGGHKCALRVIPARYVNAPDTAAFDATAAKLMQISHPALAKIQGMSLSEGSILVATDPPAGKTLEAILSVPVAPGENRFTRTQMTGLICGIGAGLHALHHCGIVHGDLCAKNVTVNKDMEPCISGYGFAAYLKDYVTLPDVRYMAPEIMAQQAKYSMEADIYSFCMLALAILTQQRPFENLGTNQVAYKISQKKRPEIPAIVPEKMKVLLTRGITEQAGLRISMSEMLYDMIYDTRYRARETDLEEFAKFKDRVLAPSLDILYIEKLERESERGDLKSRYQLGLCYLRGERTVADEERGYAFVKNAADSGCAMAMNEIGLLKEAGKGTDRDDEGAREYFKKGTECADPEATFNYGRVLRKGIGGPRNEVKAASKWKAAGDLGHILGAYRYARVMVKGEEVVRSNKESAIYFKKAADGGYMKAQYYFAVQCQLGAGIERDYTQAARYFQMAVDQECVPAMNHLGTLYEKGLGVEKKYETALELYKRATEKEHLEATFNYAYMNENGLGCSESKGRAKKYYRIAADRGYGRAQHNLANLLELEGKAEEAARYYEMAIAQPEPVHSSEYNLALMLKKGSGIPQDLARSEELFRRAAEGGNANSQYMAGKNLERQGDLEQAFSYYKKACHQNHLKATWVTAMMMWKGKGTTVDRKGTVDLFERLARKNHYPGMAMYGGILLDGELTARSEEEGVGYLRTAAENQEPYGEYRYGLYLKPTERPRAATLLKASAETGNKNAMYEFGKLNLEDGKHPVAFVWLKKAAKRRHTEALYETALLQHDGLGCTKDVAKAKQRMQLSADRGHVPAMVTFGDYCLEDNDRETAQTYFKKAADLADPAGEYRYGRELEPTDVKTAFTYYSRSAEHGYPQGIFAAAVFNDHAKGIPRNYREAVRLYSDAIEKDYVPAFVNLGILHQYGRGVEQSDDEALRLYEAASGKGDEAGNALFHVLRYAQGHKSELKTIRDMGHPIAQLSYARHLIRAGETEEGKQIIHTAAEAGYPEAIGFYATFIEDQSARIEEFKKAVALDDPFAQAELGRIYVKGLGVEKDANEGERLLRLSAEQNNDTGEYYLAKFVRVAKADEATSLYESSAALGNVKAKYRLGELALKANTKERAVELFTEGASSNHCKSLNALGKMRLEEGNREEATKCFSKSAELDNPAGQLEYGKMLFEDGEVRPALDNFKRSAEKGNLDAMIWAGKSYEKLKRPEQAEEQYRMAADKGYADGQYHLGMFLEPNDALTAQRLYRDAMAQKHGDAACRLGVLLLDSGNVFEGEKCLRQAEKDGSAEGAFRLGKYLQGTGNNGEAFEKLQVAAERKHNAASREIGLCYLEGKGVKASKTKAAQFLETAANAGDAESCYRYAGLIEADDAAKAEGYYRTASEGGIIDAKFKLGKMLIGRRKKSEGVPLLKEAADGGNIDACSLYAEHTGDVNEKRQYYRMAAEKGNTVAQLELGKLERGPEKARWLRSAAEGKISEAMFLYGQMLFEGDGVDQDVEEGKRNVHLAMKAGYDPAKAYWREVIGGAKSPGPRDTPQDTPQDTEPETNLTASDSEGDMSVSTSSSVDDDED